MGEEENPCWAKTTHLSQVVDTDLNCQGHEEFSRTIRGFWDKGLTYVKAKVIKNFSNLYAHILWQTHPVPVSPALDHV